jgi:uncharacterized protein (TIGR02145 family)
MNLNNTTKNTIAFLAFGVFSLLAIAQTGTVTNISVQQRTDGSGMVDVYFTLSGTGSFYDINIQTSFDGGNTYTPVPSQYLSGDVSGISPGSNKHVVWDGLGSFPNTYSTQAKVKILANEIGGWQPGNGVTDIDGNYYPSVIIGNQEWMAENLRATRDANGNNITRYCYDNVALNCDLYGGLYTWHTVMNGATSSNTNISNVQGICPTGWHVPSRTEWEDLVNFVVDQGYPNGWSNPNGAGNALKSCRQASSPLGGYCATLEHPRWNSHSTNYGTDQFGFSALPGGQRYSSTPFAYLGNLGLWWSSTKYSSTDAFTVRIRHDGGSMGVTRYYYYNGFSVRCVRD